MKGIIYILGTLVALGMVVFYTAGASGQANEASAPNFGIKLPPGYRDRKLISVAHEAGKNNDIRAILGNDAALSLS